MFSTKSVFYRYEGCFMFLNFFFFNPLGPRPAAAFLLQNHMQREVTVK